VKIDYEFAVGRADNGFVIEYARKFGGGVNTGYIRIVPEGETVGDHINSILVGDKLEGKAPNIARKRTREGKSVEDLLTDLDEFLTPPRSA
jgi:hypothetical protein